MNTIYKKLIVFFISICTLQGAGLHAMFTRLTAMAKSRPQGPTLAQATLPRTFALPKTTGHTSKPWNKKLFETKHESDTNGFNYQNIDFKQPRFNAAYKDYTPAALIALGLATGIYGAYEKQQEENRQKQEEENKAQEIAAQKKQKEDEIKERVTQKIKNNDPSFVDDIITCLQEDIDVSWLVELKMNYLFTVTELVLKYFSATESLFNKIGIKFAHQIKREEQCTFLINNIVKLYEQGIEEIIFPPMSILDTMPKGIKMLLEDALENNFESIIMRIDHRSRLLRFTLSDETIQNCILKHFDTIYTQKNGLEGIYYLAANQWKLKNNPAFINKLIEQITDSNPNVVGTTLTILQYHRPCHEAVIQKIEKQTYNENDVFAQLLLKKIAQCKGCNTKNTIPTTTQTEYHLAAASDADYDRDLFETILPYASNPELKRMFNSLNAKAHELEKQGYATFVHGQRWEYQLSEDLFTYLWQLDSNKSAKDFMFAHVKDPATFADRTTEEAIHTDAIKNGRPDGFGAKDNRQRLLFLNYAFFGNTSDRGSSTAHYIRANDNVNDHIRINTKDIFNYFNKNNIHEKYKTELDALQKQHQKLTNFGNCFLIAVPKDQVDQSILTVKPGGYKRTIKPSQALELLKSGKNKSTEKIDQIEFCLPMTNSQYGGLNPESGIKIFDFNAVPQQEWQDYMKKRNALFSKIARDVHQSKPISFEKLYEYIV